MKISEDHFIKKIQTLSFKDQLAILGTINLYSREPRNYCLHTHLLGNFDQNSQTYLILDSLRHAFNIFGEGGLINLWIYQENQCWYPFIKIEEILFPNDINLLPNDLTIYRGCSKNEYKNKKFKQSWSLEKSVAESFAYEHYKDQDWFNINDRCVVEAQISKKSVYYYRNSSYENEVVVNVSKLRNVNF
ncbi:hypothetical protein [Acinetobacter terrae]|uniref:hypothetical protein n=1 Tax=Acinetobacter terrae TaxID=2731247 RepID=UPI0012DC794C|nr:hypothetical protein [Acinetobacter terrae]